MQQVSNIFSVQKVPKSSKNLDCECGKKYNDRTGLWRHKIQCIFVKESHDNLVKETEDLKQEFLSMSSSELVIQLLKQNNELHQQLIDMSKEKSTIYNTINNNKVNIHMYLNEQCKDALNMSEIC